MKRKQAFLLAAVITTTLILLLGFMVGTSAQVQFGDKPTPIPAKEKVPAPIPPDEREIAILTLTIQSSEDGKIEEAGLRNAVILNAYAPNVLGLTGPWTVELVREGESIKYGILDPRRVEVENLETEEDNMKDPYISFIETDATFELIVPLFDGGKDLQVTEIVLYDENGEPFFNVAVDRAKWGGRQ